MNVGESEIGNVRESEIGTVREDYKRERERERL